MKNIYENRKTFNKAFKKFIWQDHLLNLLPGCGWNDGGCRSLMKAFQIWLASENLQTYQIVQRKEDLHSEHALIHLGVCFIDGEGLSTYQALYKRWRYTESFPSVYIRRFNPDTEPPYINNANTIIEEPFYMDLISIDRLVKELDDSFDKQALMDLMQRK